MILNLQNVTFSFGENVLFKNVNFEIKNNEKIAIIGKNGCGKTTFLKIILGEYDLPNIDGETIIYNKGKNVKIGVLSQIVFKDLNVTLEDEIRKILEPFKRRKKELEQLLNQLENNADEKIIEKYTMLEEAFRNDGGYYYEKEYSVMVKKFGFSEVELAKKLSEFSGGERTKIAFIKLLLSKPDVLILDEPTNHLDMNTIMWLEKYLKNYPKAVVAVSHDREFIDNFTNIIYEIENKKMTRYVGNYTDYKNIKLKQYNSNLKKYNEQQKEIKRLEEIVIKFKNKPTKASMARSKLKAIEHMEKIEKPAGFDESAFHYNIESDIKTGNDVLYIKDLIIGYDKNIITRDINLDVKKGNKIGIIGGNGLGKSTFVKTIAGKLPKLAGEYNYGSNVIIGYFDQQMALYTSEKSVLDDFWDQNPMLSETEVRNILGAFLFRGDDVLKEVNVLSGGEKVRLMLAKILQKKPNVLILDEPTNHMDIFSKESFENMLKQFSGTIIFVSHDRYFVKKISNSIVLFNKDNCIVRFPFGYEEYEEKYIKVNKDDAEGLIFNHNILESSNEKSDIQSNIANNSISDEISGKDMHKMMKEKNALERKIYDREQKIEEYEKKINDLKTELNKPENATKYEKLMEIEKEIKLNEKVYNELVDEWEGLNIKLEEIAVQLDK